MSSSPKPAARTPKQKAIASLLGFVAGYARDAEELRDRASALASSMRSFQSFLHALSTMPPTKLPTKRKGNKKAAGDIRVGLNPRPGVRRSD